MVTVGRLRNSSSGIRPFLAAIETRIALLHFTKAEHCFVGSGLRAFVSVPGSGRASHRRKHRPRICKWRRRDQKALRQGVGLRIRERSDDHLRVPEDKVTQPVLQSLGEVTHI